MVDDKNILVADPTSANPGSKNRRKSAFAEEDEGYQYVEEGFRIRFANGETIDFYADSREEKDKWIQALSQVMGKPEAGAKAARWTDLVLTRERVEGRPVDVVSSSPMKQSGVEVHDFTKPSPTKPRQSERKPIAPPRDASKSAPTSPAKGPSRTAPTQPSAVTRPNTPPMSPRKGHRARDAVKSMIF